MSALVALVDVALRRHEVGPGPREDLRAFAFAELPRVLALYQHRQASGMVVDVARGLQRHLGPVAALELLVARAEAEPRWLRLQRQDLWSQASWFLADLRDDAPVPAALEARLLVLVVRELKDDLAHPGERGGAQAFCQRGHAHFWAAKEGDFARAAREVLAERPESTGRLLAVAAYLHDGLERAAEAIALLAERAGRGALGLEGRVTLAGWLAQAGRWAEAVPLLRALVVEQPGEVAHRAALVVAAARAGQPDLAARARKDAEAALRELGAWREGQVATLAGACVEAGLHADAVDLWREAIALHVKAAPGRGVGDGALAQYYGQLAAALSGLGRTDEAVDAAAGAVVAWGRQVELRAQALAALEAVLAAAADLKAYGARLDAETARTGLENPTLRRALGAVWLRRGDAAEAERHLARGLEVAPADVEAARLLVAALDAQGHGADAAERLLGVALAAAHELDLWRDLAARYAALGQADEAERAWTMMVEVLPAEAEGHRALAERREAQGAWPAAVDQWRQFVRCRSDEPAGWLGLGGALVRTEAWDEAAEVVRRLEATTWDPRFGDVRAEAAELARRVRERR